MLLSKCLLNSSVQLSGEEVKMGLTPKKTAPLNLPHSLYSVFLSEADPYAMFCFLNRLQSFLLRQHLFLRVVMSAWH